MKKCGLLTLLIFLPIVITACQISSIVGSNAKVDESVPSMIENGMEVEIRGGLQAREGDIIIGNYNNFRIVDYINAAGEVVQGPVNGINVTYQPENLTTPTLQVHPGMAFVAFGYWFHVMQVSADNDVVVAFIALSQTEQRPQQLDVDINFDASLEDYTPFVVENLKVEISDPLDLPLAVSDDEVMVGMTAVVKLQILDAPDQYLYERLPVGGELDLGRYSVCLEFIEDDLARISVESRDQDIQVTQELMAENYSGEVIALPEDGAADWGRWTSISLREAGYARYLKSDGMMVGPMYELLLEDESGIFFSKMVYEDAVVNVFGFKIGVVGWQKPDDEAERTFGLVMDYETE